MGDRKGRPYAVFFTDIAKRYAVLFHARSCRNRLVRGKSSLDTTRSGTHG